MGFSLGIQMTCFGSAMFFSALANVGEQHGTAIDYIPILCYLNKKMVWMGQKD